MSDWGRSTNSMFDEIHDLRESNSQLMQDIKFLTDHRKELQSVIDEYAAANLELRHENEVLAQTLKDTQASLVKLEGEYNWKAQTESYLVSRFELALNDFKVRMAALERKVYG